MSQADFLSLYTPVRDLDASADKLSKLKKDEVIEKLCQALKALKKGEQVIANQADTIIATNAELLQQCAENRKMLTVKTDPIVHPTLGSYANAIKRTIPPLVIKTKDDAPGINSQDSQNKIRNAPKNVSVSSTRITKNGNMIINLPNETAKEKAQKNPSNACDENFEIATVKKLQPKLTVVGLPSNFDASSFKEVLSSKDEILKRKLENDNSVEILGCWEMKNENGVVVSKKLALRVSPEVRHHIINLNEGYVYLNLARYRTYDRLLVTQCFHCYGYNHIAKNCPEKFNPPICGRCSLQHDTKTCTSISEKCANCAKHSTAKQDSHCAFSYTCPLHENERNNLMKRTDYDLKN